MSEPTTASVVVAAVSVGGFAGYFAGLNPELATASIFGAFAFLALSVRMKISQRLLLVGFNVGAGYYFGSWAQDSYPDSRWPMIVSLSVGALGAILYASVYQYADGGERPAWLDWVLDKLPFLKGRDQ